VARSADGKRRNNMRLIAEAEAADEEKAQRRELGKRALALRSQGMSLFDVATALEVDERTASQTMAETLKALSEVMDETERSEQLALMMTSLDALQASVWGNAIAGDTRAVEAALKILDRKAKLLGLDQQAVVDARSQTLIVQGPEYADALRTIAAANRG
jgi:hypothetical protein